MIKKIILATLIYFSLLQGASAIESGKNFVTIAFHDIVDATADLDQDAVTTDRLIGFFEFLKGNGWTVLSLDDVLQANQGKKILPPKSILISFDDGYKSLYTRVYPLALAYGFPIVSALVGEWVDAPMHAKVLYSGREVPRSNFVSWDNIREMQASGKVEFISHSYALHRDVLGNPQGGRMPAATTAIYDPLKKIYESSKDYQKRLAQDFAKQNQLFKRQLGHPPRAIAWPFGRYTQEAVLAATHAGYRAALTLDDEPSNAALPMAISRYIPMANPTLAENISYLRYSNGLPSIQRIVSLDMLSLWSEDPQEADAKLGAAIERIRALGATAVLIDPVTLSEDKKTVIDSWFITPTLKLKGDFLSRVTWQMRTRAGALSFVNIPLEQLNQTFHQPTQLNQWFSDLGRMVPIDGIVFSHTHALASFKQDSLKIIGPWDTREIRQNIQKTLFPEIDRQALLGFNQIAFYRPVVKLITITSVDTLHPVLGDAVDLNLFASGLDPVSLQNNIVKFKQAGLFAETSMRRRFGLMFDSNAPPQEELLIQATRQFEISGGTAIGWRPDNLIRNQPSIKLIAPTVSSSNFPIKF